jgi:hypothetical protein
MDDSVVVAEDNYVLAVAYLLRVPLQADIHQIIYPKRIA